MAECVPFCRPHCEEHFASEYEFMWDMPFELWNEGEEAHKVKALVSGRPAHLQLQGQLVTFRNAHDFARAMCDLLSQYDHNNFFGTD